MAGLICLAASVAAEDPVRIEIKSRGNSNGRAVRPTDELVKALEALGAAVTRDPNEPTHPIVAADLHGLQVLDGQLELLKGLSTLKRLDLSACYITASDAGLAHIATLTGLEELTFFEAHCGSDRWLAPLGGLANLKVLNLDVEQYRWIPAIHDAGLANLKPLTKLERLRMSGLEITDKSLPYLEQMTNLRELELMRTGVTNAGIANLKQFPHLRKLTIRTDMLVNDDGMKVLADLPELEFLILSGNSFTGDALKHAPAKQLREVGIDGPGFSDEVFAHLQRMPNLEHVHFVYALVTDQGLPALNKLKKLKTLEILQCTINGSGLMPLKNLKHLRTLQYAGHGRLPTPPRYKIDPDALQCLQNFPLLETLEFNRSFVGNDGVAYLKLVPRLKRLQLTGAKIDDEGMIHLKPLKRLEFLHLTFNNVVGPGLAHLKGMQKLEHLIEPGPVTDEGLRYICELKNLRELALGTSTFTDNAMPLMAKLTKLEQLNLIGCKQITEKGLESLTGLTRLQELKIMGDKIDDRALAHVAKLQALRELVIIQCPVTSAGLDQLAALPNLRRLSPGDFDHGLVRRLYERNSRLIVLSNPEAPFLRGAPW